MNLIISSSRFTRCLRVQSLFGAAASNMIQKQRVKKRIHFTKGKIAIFENTEYEQTENEVVHSTKFLPS